MRFLRPRSLAPILSLSVASLVGCSRATENPQPPRGAIVEGSIASTASASVAERSESASSLYEASLGTASVANADEARALVEKLLRERAGLGAGSVSVTSESRDESGNRYYRFSQTLAGLPVAGRELVLQVNGDGEPQALLGRHEAGLETSPVEWPKDETNAVRSAVESSHAGLSSFVVEEAPERCFVAESTRAEPALHAVVSYSLSGKPHLEDVYVGAATRTLLHVRSRVCSLKNRVVTTAGHRDIDFDRRTGTTIVTEAHSSTQDAIAQKVFENMGTVYDFYRAHFGRDAADGRGGRLLATIHPADPDDVFFTGAPMSQAVFGDGDNRHFRPYGMALEVVGHELTHGVVEATARLGFSPESGALNEAIADIFGAAAYAWKKSGGTAAGDPAGGIVPTPETWKSGYEIAGPALGRDANRYMNDPARDGQSRDYYPSRYRGSEDDGGVHMNNGIGNLAFYLLSQGGSHPRHKTSVQVQPLGFEKALQIVYVALTRFLTSSSGFADARNAMTQAAVTLYGAGSAESTSVAQAWDAVGVTGKTTTGTKPNNKLPTLRRGSSGSAVAKLQQALVARGARLTVDGDFGPATEGAVRDFQRRQGLAVDGVAGPATLSALGL